MKPSIQESIGDSNQCFPAFFLHTWKDIAHLDVIVIYIYIDVCISAMACWLSIIEHSKLDYRLLVLTTMYTEYITEHNQLALLQFIS